MGRTKISDELIDEYRDINTDHDWWEDVFEDFARVAEILGFDVDLKQVSFSGFCSQGDGASFTGAYRAQASKWGSEKMGIILRNFAETAPAEIRSYAPKDTTLHAIADELMVIARIYFPAAVTITRMSSMYSHSNTMNVDVVDWQSDEDVWDLDVVDVVNASIQTQARALADWLYAQLETSHDYLRSNEAVTDAIFANDMHK